MRFLLALIILLVANKGNDYIMDDERIKNFLKTISYIESSGGKNTDHPTMESGIHSGDSAIGRYGLMPNTVKEIINRMRLAGSVPEELNGLDKVDSEKLKEIITQNPNIEDKLAESLAQRQLMKYPEEDMAAYSWNQGHNLPVERIAQTPYKEHDYVKKYNTYKQLLANKYGK